MDLYPTPSFALPPASDTSRWLSGERLGLMTWWFRVTFFPAYFRLSPLLKYASTVVGGFGKKVGVSIGGESQETRAPLTANKITTVGLRSSN